MDGLAERRTLATPVVTIYHQCQRGASGSVMVRAFVGYWWLSQDGLRVVCLPTASLAEASSAILAQLAPQIPAIVATEQDAAAESPL